MSTKKTPDLKELFKQAAEIAGQVPDNMQEAAFNRALDLLTGRTENSDRSVSSAATIKKTKANKKKTTKATARKGAKTKAKAISPERFDIHKSGKTTGLKEFLEEKEPGKSTGNIIAVIAYFIVHIRKNNFFTEGNIDYAYRTLRLKKRPKHLRQIIINNKNQRDLFEEGDEDGHWLLTRTGEIFVEEELPVRD